MKFTTEKSDWKSVVKSAEHLQYDPTVIYSFGVPRSGTTLLSHMFAHNGGQYLYRKIPENTKYHPGMDRLALYNVVEYYKHWILYLVRTKRHPVDCIESRFVQYPETVGNESVLNLVISWIRQESEGFWYSYEKVKKEGFCNVSFIQVYFDDLGCEKKRWEIYNHFATIDLALRNGWNDVMERVWNKEPLREGKLEDGQRGLRFMPDQWVEKICRELSDVIEKDGLKGRSGYVDENGRIGVM